MERHEFQKVLLLSAGAVVIGRSNEFDYASVEACKVLKEEGLQVIVLSNNPATIITDPGLADRIYIEPLTVDTVEKIIIQEKPDTLLLNFGGRIAFDLGNRLAKSGFLEQHGIKLAGIHEKDLDGMESNEYYRERFANHKLKIPAGETVAELKSGLQTALSMGFPVIIRSFSSPEGMGTVIAYNQEELEEFLHDKLAGSADSKVWLEESLLGWKEFAVEILRDNTGACIVPGCLEQIDPMGIHSGDSIAVWPPQTLSTEEYRTIVSLCEKIGREIDLIGNANIKLAQNPVDKEFYVSKINRSFTRSTATFAKATGLPLVEIATKLMLGCRLEEFDCLRRIIEDAIPAGYVAVRFPRFEFAKFPTADNTLNTVMKSIGETIAIGQNFKEAFQKGIRSLDIGLAGFSAEGSGSEDETDLTMQHLRLKLANPHPEQFLSLRQALKMGCSVEEVNQITGIHSHFLKELAELVSLEKHLTTYALYNLKPETLLKAKQWGFSDIQIAGLLRSTEVQVRETRRKMGINPEFSMVQTGMTDISGAKNSLLGYYYSTYNHIVVEKGIFPIPAANSTSPPADSGKKVIIVGPGPNRIDRGGEFEYSLAHATQAIREMGCEAILINNNPGAFSTSPGFYDKLYWEPLSGEELLSIFQKEQPSGVMLQFAGSSVAAAVALHDQSGIKILDNQPGFNEAAINSALLQLGTGAKISLLPGITAPDVKSAQEAANTIGFPILAEIVEPVSSILPEIIFNQEDLGEYFRRIFKKNRSLKPIIRLEKFLEDALAVEVSCITDGDRAIITGVMEQIEEAGISSGDSALASPPYTLGQEILADLKEYTRKIVVELKVKGLLNLHYSIKHNHIYLQTVSRSANRLIPGIMKSTGTDWIKVATGIFLGKSLPEQEIVTEKPPLFYFVKEAVFSFERFPGVDAILGPGKRSTGQVIGIGKDFGLAFIKSQLAAGERLPLQGNIFVSIKDENRRAFIPIVRQLVAFGFKISATEDTAQLLSRNGIACETAKRVGEGRPNILDQIKNGGVQWVFNTPAQRTAFGDESLIRSTAVSRGIPIITTIAAAQAVVTGFERYLAGEMEIREISEF